jgi:predicted nucleotidyltransferase
LTPYPQLDRLLRGHAAELKEALGGSMIGYYLQGSLAIGDFDLTSDVDFTVVVQEELSASQVEAVQEIHSQTYAQEIRWAKHLEYGFFPLALMREPSPIFPKGDEEQQRRRELWFFNHGSPELERTDHNNSLVTRWSVREKGIAVLGPDPKSFLPPIHPDELRRETRATMLDWGAVVLADPEPHMNRFFQAYLVLNYSRMLQDLYEGRITSKRAGAEWAKQNLDPRWRPLIDFCWEERQDSEISVTQPAVPEKFEQVLEFVAYTMEKAAAYEVGGKK